MPSKSATKKDLPKKLVCAYCRRYFQPYRRRKDTRFCSTNCRRKDWKRSNARIAPVDYFSNE
jgi:hypothetical protein